MALCHRGLDNEHAIHCLGASVASIHARQANQQTREVAQDITATFAGNRCKCRVVAVSRPSAQRCCSGAGYPAGGWHRRAPLLLGKGQRESGGSCGKRRAGGQPVICGLDKLFAVIREVEVEVERIVTPRWVELKLLFAQQV